MIRFRCWCQLWSFWILLCLLIYVSTFISKAGSLLQHVSDKVISAKWQHWTYGNIMFLSKSDFIIQTPIFRPLPPLRFLYLINSFYGRYVSSMYNRSNRLIRFNRSNSTEGQQFKKKRFHPNNLTVAKGWFSWLGLEGGGHTF